MARDGGKGLIRQYYPDGTLVITDIGGGAGGPSLWQVNGDRLEPVDFTKRTFAPNLGLCPVSAPTTLSATPGGVGVLTGNYRYKVTYVASLGMTALHGGGGLAPDFGETNLGANSNTVTLASQACELSSIPVSTDPRVVGRKIYRTKAGDLTRYYYLAEIADNTTTTYTDNTPDGGLGPEGTSRDNTAGGWLFCVDSASIIKVGFIGRNDIAFGRHALEKITYGHSNTAFGVGIFRSATRFITLPRQQDIKPI